MSVVLPTTGYSSASVVALDFGGLVTPPLGGAQQRINRLGNRFAVQAQLPIMTPKDAMAWIAALESGQQAGVIARVPQVDFVISHPGTPLVAGAGQTGSTINVDGLTPGYAVQAGQMLNLSVAGRIYLYRAAAPVRAGAGGTAAITLTTMIRKSPVDNSAVELMRPLIEGFLTGEQSWNYDSARRIGISFSVAEAA